MSSKQQFTQEQAQTMYELLKNILRVKPSVYPNKLKNGNPSHANNAMALWLVCEKIEHTLQALTHGGDSDE